MGCLVYLIAIAFLFAGEPGYAALIICLALLAWLISPRI